MLLRLVFLSGCFKGVLLLTCEAWEYDLDDTCTPCPSHCSRCINNLMCTACNPGYYGKTCENRCSESCNERKCLQENGQCLSCVRGHYFAGNKSCVKCPGNCVDCQSENKCTSCEVGFKGDTCKEECTNCRHGAGCTLETGVCISGCQDGYSGHSCLISCNPNCQSCERIDANQCIVCVEGRYGENCDKTCSTKCKNDSCSSGSGICTHGCEEGYWGDLCEYTCPRQCLGGICYRNNGSCSNGCAGNFTGNKCLCPDKCECNAEGVCERCSNHSDYLCDKLCRTACIGNVCQRGIQTKCLYGYKQGYDNSICNLESQPLTPVPGMIGLLVGGILEVVLVISIIYIIIWCRERKNSRSPEKLTEDEVEEKTALVMQEYRSKNACTDMDYIRPGKPTATDIKVDSLILSWDSPENFQSGHYYKVSYKDVDSGSKWVFLPGEYIKSAVEITGLKSNTKFVFRVHVVYVDDEGPYSPESEICCTNISPALRLFPFAKQIEDSTPKKLILQKKEVKNDRNESAKSRMKKFEIGSPLTGHMAEKTILLVGATGAGKSTLVDGIVNYVLGVNWCDSYRFSVMDFEQEKKGKHRNQTLSDWITCYTLHPQRDIRIKYKLNIIDMPGCEEARDSKQAQKNLKQLLQPLSGGYIDAVCFVMKALDAVLIGKPIVQSVIENFKENSQIKTCSLITFADSQDPPILKALGQSSLPYGKPFIFNNSCLFAKNVGIGSVSLAPIFWDMGLKSFGTFFNYLDTAEHENR